MYPLHAMNTRLSSLNLTLWQKKLRNYEIFFDSYVGVRKLVSIE